MGQYDDFFDGAGFAGGYAFKFDQIGRQVWGPIVDIRKTQCTVYASNPPVKETNDDGSPRMQLEVTIQTDLRNWAGLSKVPTNENGQPLPPTDDDGKRRLFVKKSTNLHFRLGDALVAAGQNGQKASLEVGGLLAVKWVSERQGSKGNPTKEYEVIYKPAPPQSPAAGFFPEQQQAAPAQQYQQAPPVQQAPPQQFQQPQYQQAPPAQQPIQPYVAPQAAQGAVFNPGQGQYVQPPAQQPAPQQQFVAQPPVQVQGDPWAQQPNLQADQPPF